MNVHVIFTLILTVLFLFSAHAKKGLDDKLIATATANGKLATEGFVRSMLFVNGWLTRTDPVTGLIPTNLDKSKDIWEPHNSAADNWAFMVLTTYLLDKELYHGKMLDMLKTERKLTSRVKSLPDTWSFSKTGFKTDTPDMNWVIFGVPVLSQMNFR